MVTRGATCPKIWPPHIIIVKVLLERLHVCSARSPTLYCAGVKIVVGVNGVIVHDSQGSWYLFHLSTTLEAIVRFP